MGTKEWQMGLIKSPLFRSLPPVLIMLLAPGLGEVASTFVPMSDFVKWIGILAMLLVLQQVCIDGVLGHLEIFTVLVLFYPTFWMD